MIDTINTSTVPASTHNYPGTRTAAVLVLAFILAACAFIYELALGAAITQIGGNSTQGFSLTVGVFVSALGLGAYGSRWLQRSPAGWFAVLEIVLSLAGGFAVALLQRVQAWPGVFYLLALFLTVGIGALVGLEVPLLIQLLGDGRLPEKVANVLAFDYFGGLAGSLVFAWVLEPRLGLAGATVLTGLVNLGAAVLAVAVFPHGLSRPRLTCTAIGLTAVGLVAGWTVLAGH